MIPTREEAIANGTPIFDFVLSNKPSRKAKPDYSAEPMRQAKLFSGLDCLPGQENLPFTEGEEVIDHG